ncbi:MAG: 3-hydroxyacyl-CoA dehydrogenase/enoyl-CoA hydratase family protein [Gammaproteobacteria bacterium]|nr:3-hydroxyacyl-CoA dehydrogenase/enoyl-CoA hydratase family protein [Gammaproteobacteria bacterium]
MNPTHIAVIGSGTMGAQIAAHFANAGFSVYLFDLKKEGVNLAEAGKARLLKMDPEPFASKQFADFIVPKNLQDDLACLQTCDLVIEAISENLKIKADVYAQIAPYLNEHACLASNTSGLSISALADHMPKIVQPRFLGMHFFNPPRYLPLVELVPHAQTCLQLLDDLETFLVSHLGKEVVRAKDTPNFIANRLGVYGLLTTLQHAVELNIPLEVVDELTGKLIGRPKSATCRTMDLVGLDVLSHVVATMGATCPDWLQGLINQGALGAKTKKGIYQKTAEGLMVWDIAGKTYRPAIQKANSEFVKAIKTAGFVDAWPGLEANPLPEAQFLFRLFRDLFAYAHQHLAEISGSRIEVDRALKFGFGWKQGLFELESAIHGKPYADTIPEHLNLPVYARQKYPASPKIVFENEGAYAWEHEGALVLSFKTKLCTIGNSVLDALNQARECAEQSYKGLIIWQRESEHFSAGADLMNLAGAFMLGGASALEAILSLFQNTVLALRYAKVPVLTAVRGYVLGGGCELAMHSHKVVAALETYMGLVEVGVGIVPGAGGSKEMALRASQSSNAKEKLLQYFKQIAMAEAAKSAYQAKEMGYLRESDVIIMNPNELLYVAMQELNALVAQPFVRVREAPIKMQGLPAWGNMMGSLQSGRYLKRWPNRPTICRCRLVAAS